MSHSCPYCNEEYSRLGRHIPYCKNKPDDITKKEAKIESIKVRSDVEITKGRLEGWYHEEEKSLPEISKLTGLSVGLVSDIFDLLGLETRSYSSAGKKAVNKREKTCIEKYGVKNPSQHPDIKEKKRKTFLENYGVDNIFKSDSFCVWLNNYMEENYGKCRITNVDKQKKTKKERYGNENYNNWEKAAETYKEKYGINKSKYHKSVWEDWSVEKKQKHLQRLRDFNTYDSSLEEKFASFLETKNYSYEQQKFINRSSYDFLLINYSVLVEINGDFWHANPIKYRPNDILNHPDGKIEAKKLWEKDVSKIKNAEDYGYIVYTIWENELRSNFEKVKTDFNNFVKNYEN